MIKARAKISTYGTRTLRFYENNSDMRLDEAAELVRDGCGVDFSLALRYLPETCVPVAYISMIKEMEHESGVKDTLLLSRIVRKGGFINYIRALEN